MPMMKMPRNWTVRTRSGHTIRFEKDQPTHVPDDFAVIEQCRRFAAEYVDAHIEAPLPDEEALVFDAMPKTPDERRSRILNLLNEMKDNQAAHRNHFTAASNPSVKYVNTKLGFEVRGEEVKEMWREVLNAGKVVEE